MDKINQIRKEIEQAQKLIVDWICKETDRDAVLTYIGEWNGLENAIVIIKEIQLK